MRTKCEIKKGNTKDYVKVKRWVWEIWTDNICINISERFSPRPIVLYIDVCFSITFKRGDIKNIHYLYD